MDDKEIIEAAREAGITQAVGRGTDGTFRLLQRFAAIIEAKAYERAAVVCDSEAVYPRRFTGSFAIGAECCAAAIRALKEK